MHSLKDTKVDDNSLLFSEYQHDLINLVDENYSTFYEKYNDKFKKDDYAELASNIVISSALNKNDNVIFKYISDLLNELDEDEFCSQILLALSCRDMLFPYTRLMRFLYTSGYIKLEKFEDYLFHMFDDVKYYIFAKEFEYPDYFQNFIDRDDCDWSLFDEIVEYGFIKDSIGYSIYTDDLEMFKKLSDSHEFQFNQEIKGPFFNTCTRSLLNHASFSGSYNIFRYLLEEKGVEMDNDTCKFAVSGGNLDIISLCEKKGADFSNSLINCVYRHKHELFDKLITEYKCKTSDSIGIYHAVHMLNYKVFFYLIQTGEYKKPDSNFTNVDIPLVQATRMGLYNICKVLLDHNISNIHDCDQEFDSFTWAVRCNRLNIVKLFVERNADINKRCNASPDNVYSDFSPADIAKENNFNEIYDYLTSKNAVKTGAA